MTHDLEKQLKLKDLEIKMLRGQRDQHIRSDYSQSQISEESDGRIKELDQEIEAAKAQMEKGDE